MESKDIDSASGKESKISNPASIMSNQIVTGYRKPHHNYIHSLTEKSVENMLSTSMKSLYLVRNFKLDLGPSVCGMMHDARKLSSLRRADYKLNPDYLYLKMESCRLDNEPEPFSQRRKKHYAVFGNEDMSVAIPPDVAMFREIGAKLVTPPHHNEWLTVIRSKSDLLRTRTYFQVSHGD